MDIYRTSTKVLIITHYTNRSEEGEDTDMRLLGYLKNRVKEVILITHPLPEFGHRTSYCLVWKDGIKVKELRTFVVGGSEIFKYIHHILITYYFFLRIGFRFNLCIAIDNLAFVTVFPLKLVGLILKVIYYSVDYSPKRFSNELLNNFYHFIDKFACIYSDQNWVMVKEQIIQRVKKPKDKKAFSIVPIGYDTKKIDLVPVDNVNYFNLVYMGAIRESMGPQLAIQAMPLLLKVFPKIRLTLVGGGKYSDELKKMVKTLRVGKYVEFTGYIDKFKDLTEIIAKKSIGLAPYKPVPGSFSYFSDPSKIKLYMCCGLPVITTNVATLSSMITETGSGVTINYSKEDLADAVVHLLRNKIRYSLYKKRAIIESRKFDINAILRVAIKKIPD